MRSNLTATLFAPVVTEFSKKGLRKSRHNCAVRPARKKQPTRSMAYNVCKEKVSFCGLTCSIFCSPFSCGSAMGTGAGALYIEARTVETFLIIGPVNRIVWRQTL
jgi:hypothetical protein